MGTNPAAAAARVDPGTDAGVPGARYIECAFQAHHMAVLRFCVSRLRDQDDAEDAVQEVFARAVRHQAELRGDPLGWLIRTASNICTDELRRRARHATDHLDTEHETVPAAPGHEPESVVVGRMLIGDLLAELTTSERKAVADRALFDSDDPDRTALGITTSTTRVLLCRARRRMRHYLETLEAGVGAVIGTVWLRTRRARESNPEAWSASLRVGVPGLVAATIVLSTTSALPVTALAPTTRASAQPVALAPAGLQAAPPARMPAITAGVSAAGPAPAARQALALPLQPYQPRVQEATVTDVEPSPNYAQDHTVLATGGDARCPSSPCQALFISHDAGHTWTALPAQGFHSTQLLLPAATFAAGQFFGFGPGGLQETTDGGKTFRTTIPDLPGYASVTPAGLGALFAVSNTARWDFTSGVSPSLGAAFIPGGEAEGPVAFAGSGVALQPVLRATAAGLRVQVARCTSLGCAGGPDLPWSITTMLSISPVPGSGAVLASDGSSVAFSRDGGATFSLLNLPSGSNAARPQLVAGPMGSRIVAALGSAGKAGGLEVSDDAGATWTRVLSLPGPWVPPMLVRTGASSLIAAIPGASQRDSWFACSNDAGTTWRPC